MATRWARVARGLIAAGFAVFITAFAHVAGGGALPSIPVLTLAFSFAALACIALAGRRVSRWRIATSVILSQGALHLLFMLTSGGHGAMTVPMAGMNMPGMRASLSVAAEPASASLYTGGWMWLAHAAAATLTIVALFWGESAFWSICRSAAVMLARSLYWPVPQPRQAKALLHVFARSHYRRGAHFLLTGLRHRGPPRLAAAST